MDQPLSNLQENSQEALIAIHGVSCQVPAGWEVVGTYGGWRKGHLLVAAGREPRVSVSWRRHAEAPDLARTLHAAGSRLDRSHVAGTLMRQDELATNLLLGAWTGPQGDFHAAVRHFPAQEVTVVARQLAPGPSEPLRQLISSVQAVAARDGSRWAIYGLALDLPAWWRLEGLQQLAGLVRGVWFRYPQGRLRPDQVLVMRRLACASRLLQGRTLGAWVQGGLVRHERVVGDDEHQGLVHLSTELPSAHLWRRLIGRRDRREIYAWTQPAGDRLLVQEWRGATDPLPCLRDSQRSPRFKP